MMHSTNLRDSGRDQTPAPAASTGDHGTEDCPRCSRTIPLPLENFCGHCLYRLRVDSEERAARVRAENARRIREQGF